MATAGGGRAPPVSALDATPHRTPVRVVRVVWVWAVWGWRRRYGAAPPGHARPPLVAADEAPRRWGARRPRAERRPGPPAAR
eukprot:gene5362-24243_t